MPWNIWRIEIETKWQESIGWQNMQMAADSLN